MQPESLLIGLVLGVLVTIAIYSARGRRPVNLAQPTRVPIGKYLGGFAAVTSPEDQIDCQIDASAFVIINKHNREFGRIPRSAVVEIFCEEKPQLLPRLTATKNINFSNLGIGSSKNQSLKGYCLVIDWQIGDTRNNVIFEFHGLAPRANAHGVETILKSHCKSHAPALRFDERNCPYCREVIKREALLCKHCRSRVIDHIPNRINVPL